jgi:hypothetical protein
MSWFPHSADAGTSSVSRTSNYAKGWITWNLLEAVLEYHCKMIKEDIDVLTEL